MYDRCPMCIKSVLIVKEGINVKFEALHMIIESHNSIYDDMKKIISFGKNK